MKKIIFSALIFTLSFAVTTRAQQDYQKGPQARNPQPRNSQPRAGYPDRFADIAFYESTIVAIVTEVANQTGGNSADKKTLLFGLQECAKYNFQEKPKCFHERGVSAIHMLINSEDAVKQCAGFVEANGYTPSLVDKTSQPICTLSNGDDFVLIHSSPFVMKERQANELYKGSSAETVRAYQVKMTSGDCVGKQGYLHTVWPKFVKACTVNY